MYLFAAYLDFFIQRWPDDQVCNSSSGVTGFWTKGSLSKVDELDDGMLRQRADKDATWNVCYR